MGLPPARPSSKSTRQLRTLTARILWACRPSFKTKCELERSSGSRNTPEFSNRSETAVERQWHGPRRPPRRLDFCDAAWKPLPGTSSDACTTPVGPSGRTPAYRPTPPRGCHDATPSGRSTTGRLGLVVIAIRNQLGQSPTPITVTPGRPTSSAHAQDPFLSRVS